MVQLTRLKAAIICLLTLISTAAQAADVTYDFQNGIPSAWTASVQPNGIEATDLARGTQFTSSATLTLKGVSNVTKVVITCSCNIASGNSIEVKAGGKSWGVEALTKENDVVKTFTGAAASGDLTIELTRTSKSIYIKKIVVSGEAPNGGNDGGNTGDEQGLDESYTYAEPTVVTPSGASSSNAPYTFVQNNIKVSATAGAQNDIYFGCNAGNSITFTATRPIKALVIDGYIKKDFTAEATSGELYYADASEDAVDSDPVLAILDIDSKTVTLSCDKQMRCYRAHFYFEENPDLGGDDDEPEYNFDYEPTTPTNLDITFDEIQYEDWSDYIGFPYVDVFLANDDYEMEIEVLSPTVPGTLFAPGTYIINDSGDEGTVLASPGGDDETDFPAYIATGFEYDPDYEEWYYTTSYYIESGTLTVKAVEGGYILELNGKTHFGSTVHAIYRGTAADIIGDDDPDAIASTTASATATTPVKVLDKGKVAIKFRNKVYDTNGAERK